MVDIRLVQITALSNDQYELVFLEGDEQHRFTCEVDSEGKFPVVASADWLYPMNPDYDGPLIENWRAVTELVLAMHRAHNS